MAEIKSVNCPTCSSSRAIQHMKGIYCPECKSGIRPTPYLCLISLWVVMFGIVVTMMLNLGIEPFCNELGILCGTGVIKLVVVGFGTSIGFTALLAAVMYLLTRSVSKTEMS